MLICKNCFTENPDGTIKCHQCNMEGNFIHKASEGQSGPVWKVEKHIHCNNCGSEAPGEGSNCVHCNFPIPANKRAKRHEHESMPYNHLKTKTG